jgi:hypothetical protein
MRLTNSSVVSSRFSRLGLVQAMIACSLRLMDTNECAYCLRASPRLSQFFLSAYGTVLAYLTPNSYLKPTIMYAERRRVDSVIWMAVLQ